MRPARAGPLLEDLRAWLASMLGKVSKKSELAKAIGYSLGRWTSLTRYRDDGRTVSARLDMTVEFATEGSGSSRSFIHVDAIDELLKHLRGP